MKRVSLLMTFTVTDDVTVEQVRDLATDAYVQIEDPRTRDGGRLPGDIDSLDSYLVVDGTCVLTTHPLADAVDALGDTSGWPGYLTCTEAEALAAILRALGAEQLADDVVLAHAENDDEDELVSHPGGDAGVPPA